MVTHVWLITLYQLPSEEIFLGSVSLDPVGAWVGEARG